MKVEQIFYDVDGLQMVGDIYLPATPLDGGPAVLAFPEAFGIGEHVRQRAERLAGLGYVAMACDLHGGAALLTDIGEVMSRLEPLLSSSAATRTRGSGALQALISRPEVDPGRVAAIGYCFGGTIALELARAGAPLRAVAGFHSGLRSPEPPEPKKIDANILVCVGADDPQIPAEQREAFEREMSACGADWQLHVYGGVVHSFTNPAADALLQPEFARYDAAADARSWASLTSFLAENLGC